MKGTRLRALTLVLGSLAACRPAGGAPAAPVLLDDAGGRIHLAAPPARIVSLNPTTTELLFALGAGPRLVGRSDACDFPAGAAAVPSVGAGFPPAVEAVVGTRPDLVVLYHSAGNAAAAARLRHLGVPVIRLRTDRLADVARAARVLGRVTGAPAAGDSIADRLEAELDRLRPAPADSARLISTLLLAWDQPVIALGAGSFASELVELAGGRNVFGDLAAPSVPVSLEAIAQRAPAVLLLVGSELPGLERRPEWRVLPAVRAGRVLRLTESSSNRPSPRAPAAIRALRSRLAALMPDST
ncbi:MAG: ABC transporter substrate-binding protein [Gemmatimonadales bacterium]|nr:ABC transporter substrate-binding protein [Gemmatimonadales bacterium]